MQYSADELLNLPISEFQHDPNQNVCVTQAIHASGASTNIDSEACIQCGICVLRCPFDVIQMRIAQPPLVGGDGTSNRRLPLIDVDEIERHAASFNEFVRSCSKEQKDLLLRNIFLSMGHAAAIGRGNATRVVALSKDKDEKLNIIRTDWGKKPDPEHVRRLAFDDLPMTVPAAYMDGIEPDSIRAILVFDVPHSRREPAAVQIATALALWPPYHRLLSIQLIHLAQLMWADAWKNLNESDFEIVQTDISRREAAIRQACSE
jgi:ferredoxin